MEPPQSASVDLQELLRIAKKFTCPVHPDRDIREFCFTDSTFGCQECVDYKPEEWSFAKTRSSTSAVKVIEKLISQQNEKEKEKIEEEDQAKRVEKSARTIQELWRKSVDRKKRLEEEDKESSIRRIQRIWRDRAAEKKRSEEERKESSSIKIQQFWKRKRDRALREEEENKRDEKPGVHRNYGERGRAATAIQNFWRKYFGPAEESKRDPVVYETKALPGSPKRKFRTEEEAASKIQRFWKKREFKTMEKKEEEVKENEPMKFETKKKKGRKSSDRKSVVQRFGTKPRDGHRS